MSPFNPLEKILDLEVQSIYSIYEDGCVIHDVRVSGMLVRPGGRGELRPRTKVFSPIYYATHILHQKVLDVVGIVLF